jgi:class 3 adenylate cyclase/pimeloyl-ACP methyl ester carboxylesterase
MPAMEPEIRYCTTDDGVTIAYAISGRGDRWFVHTPNAASAAIQLDGVPGRREWIEALGGRFKVVEYDTRGTGLSQRECDDLTPESQVRDLTAVMDAIGSEKAALFGYLGGCYAASWYAINQPQRVSHLLLWPPPLIDWGSAARTPLAQLAISDWETFTETYAHTALGWAKGEQSHAYAAVMRETVTRETWLRSVAFWTTRSQEENWGHVRDIAVPTLVVQRENYPSFAFIAGPIPGATIRRVPGESHGTYVDNPGALLDVIFEFTGATAPPSPAPEVRASTRAEHGTAVILFTDIADSTPLTEGMGDAAFREASRALDDHTRTAIRDAGGTPVEGKVLGDGVMGVFASAAQAIEAARRCVAASSEAELPLHIGLHAGDVIHEKDNVYGGAVNIASRVCNLCAPGEILVSQTVRDLARTSAGVTFEDRGDYALKGIEDPVRIFAVRVP